jgi:hypothetical protein
VAAIAMLLACAAPGCGTSDTVTRVEGLADQACACRDAACADRVDRAFRQLVEGGPRRGSPGERDRVETAYARMRSCLARARSRPAGAAPAL